MRQESNAVAPQRGARPRAPRRVGSLTGRDAAWHDLRSVRYEHEPIRMGPNRSDEMKKEEARAGIKGAAKQAKTALKGQTGIFDTLAKEHGLVSSLMNQVREGDVETRRQLFPKIRAELISHAHAEEEEFYSVLLGYEETREIALHSMDEHEEIERLVDEIDSVEVESEAWMRAFEQMRERVEQHVQEEENELFPLARDALERAELAELDDRFMHEKERQLNALGAAG